MKENKEETKLQSEQKTAEEIKLQAFKDYVHRRLDLMGIEKDPESEHKEKGCRIGGLKR